MERRAFFGTLVGGLLAWVTKVISAGEDLALVVGPWSVTTPSAAAACLGFDSSLTRVSK